MVIAPGIWLGPAALVSMAGIIIWGCLKMVNGPLGRALADRLRGDRADATDEVLELRTEVAALREEMSDLQERLNFAERLLITAPRPEPVEEPTPV